jgi:phosphotransferase system HPr-like phosphotransfer protein
MMSKDIDTFGLTVTAGFLGHSPIVNVVAVAQLFPDVSITIAYEDYPEDCVDAKSVMSLISLAITEGAVLCISTKGPRAELAAKCIAKILATREEQLNVVRDQIKRRVEKG